MEFEPILNSDFLFKSQGLSFETVDFDFLKSEFQYKFNYNKNFKVHWISPCPRREALEWFDEHYQEMRFELAQILHWDESKWGSWNNVKMPVLRNCVNVEYPNTFTNWKTFLKNVFYKMGEYYKAFYDPSLNDVDAFKQFVIRKSNLADSKGYVNVKALLSYLKLAYLGFLKQERVGLVLASSKACLNRDIDIYETDLIGDLKCKQDFMIYRHRPQHSTLSRGYWKAIGVGSKYIKNETEQNVSFMIYNQAYSDDCFSLGSGLWVANENYIDNLIRSNLRVS